MKLYSTNVFKIFYNYHSIKMNKCCSGLTPAGAEIKYLKKCKQIDMYGVDLLSSKVRDSPKMTELQIGLSPRGIETFKNKRRINIFYWSVVF